MRYYLFSLATLSHLYLNAQTANMVSNNAQIQAAAGTQITVGGNVINTNSSNIRNDGIIYLTGNWTQNTSANYIGGATSWMWYNGIANQTIQLTAPNSEIYRVRVDNANRLVLLSDVSATTDIDLRNNGSILLGNFNLTGGNGNVVNYDINHYIITNGTGFFSRIMNVGNTKVYPVGNSTYNPATLTSNSGSTDVFLLRVRDQILKLGTTGSNETQRHVNRTWDINEAVAGGNNLNITVEWDGGQELSPFNRPSSSIKHWSGTAWDYGAFAAATNVGGTRWTRNRTNQTAFSPFGVIDDVGTFPIELLNFNAHRTSVEKVQLDWATATETNNRGFEIQRKLDNETDFSTLGFVDGHGTTVEPHSYNYLDNNDFSGVSYYRLRQLDVDGTATFSNVSAVLGKGKQEPIVVFPNPATDHTQVRFDAKFNNQKVDIALYDMSGKLVMNSFTQVIANQTLTIQGLDNLPVASYILYMIMQNGTIYSTKLERQAR